MTYNNSSNNSLARISHMSPPDHERPSKFNFPMYLKGRGIDIVRTSLKTSSANKSEQISYYELKLSTKGREVKRAYNLMALQELAIF